MIKKRNGKAQFTALLSIIILKINEGHTGIHIYEQLIEAEKTTLSYRQFQRYLSAHISPDKDSHMQSKGIVKKHSTLPTLPHNTQKDIFRPQRKVLHNPSMTDERKKKIFG